eukprot:2436701-Amphidinium_carterae.1
MVFENVKKYNRPGSSIVKVAKEGEFLFQQYVFEAAERLTAPSSRSSPMLCQDSETEISSRTAHSKVSTMAIRTPHNKQKGTSLQSSSKARKQCSRGNLSIAAQSKTAGSCKLQAAGKRRRCTLLFLRGDGTVMPEQERGALMDRLYELCPWLAER